MARASDPQRLKRRYRAERRFRFYGFAAMAMAAGILGVLLGSIIFSSLPAFTHHHVGLTISFPADTENTSWRQLMRTGIYDIFPEVTARRDRRKLERLFSSAASDALRDAVRDDPKLAGTTRRIYVSASDDFDLLMKGIIDRTLPEEVRVISDRELVWIDRLVDAGRVEQRFAWKLFTAGDSREPEQAGLKSALAGSLLTMLVTLLLSFPAGVMAAIYLEEIAPRNRFTAFIEVNINNLAAVPSIIFGLLGLAVFINFFYLPRSAPLVGGMVLALMTLPTIIIAPAPPSSPCRCRYAKPPSAWAHRASKLSHTTSSRSPSPAS